MATTAILSALAEEQGNLRDRLDGARKVVRAGREFWIGQWQGRPVVLAVSRIGKVAAATTATALIEAFDVDRIVFTGVAGGIGAAVHVGDVVVATQFVQHDMDASPIFPRYEVPLYRQSRFPCDPELTRVLEQASRQALRDRAAQASTSHRPASVHVGMIASGDRFIAGAQACARLREDLAAAQIDALAVEMEGAAVAQVCHDYGKAFVAVRTISDRADDTAHVDFQHFVTHVACDYTLRIVSRFIQMAPAELPPRRPAAPA